MPLDMCVWESYHCEMEPNLSFCEWPSIESFASVRKHLKSFPGLLDREVMYHAKVKLHGTNAGVLISSTGEVAAQSRSGIVTPLKDNYGFASFVVTTQKFWKNLGDYRGRNFLVFGEWFGPGVQQSVACSKVPEKHFGIFGILDRDQNKAIFEPKVIEMILGRDMPKNVFVIPWYNPDGDDIGKDYSIKWDADHTSLEEGIVKEINEDVLKIERCDPLIQEKFGIQGIGEGLVFYPRAYSLEGKNEGFEAFSLLAFKAKGKEHRVVEQKVAVVVSPASAESVEAFCTLVLTPARLEQGLQVVGAEKRLTGDFLKWITADVAKECQDELAASNLTFDQVVKPLTVVARTWYHTKC